MRMTDDTTLEAFRLADSFLPVGTYTISYGLEQFVQDDRIGDAADLETLLSTYLKRQVGPAELVALRAAHTAARKENLDAVCVADRQLTAVTMAAEFRRSAQQSGDRLLSLQRELHEDKFLDRYADRVNDDAPGNYPIVLGTVTALESVEEREVCLLYCHGFVTGLLGVAQRLLSLGHTDAQRILDNLRPVMVEAVDDSAKLCLDNMTPFSPLLDILAADHERAERRLFVS